MIDRELLFNKALAETTSISEALALLERVVAVIGTPSASAPVVVPVLPIVEVVAATRAAPIPVAQLARLARVVPTKRRTAIKPALSHFAWTPDRRVEAEDLLAEGWTIEEVAEQIYRTPSALETAIYSGIVKSLRPFRRNKLNGAVGAP